MGRFYDINPTIVNMMRSTEKTVHLIVDHLNTSFVPMGVFMHARNLFAAYPANCDLIIITTPNVLVQRLMTIFQATYKGGLGERVKPAASIAAAYALMEESAREHAAKAKAL